MVPMIRDVHIEELPDKLKVVLPTERRPLWILIYSILLTVWLLGFFWIIVFTLRDVAFSGERYAIVFTIMLLIWLYIWYRLGKVVWHQWQYYVAPREILFIEKERLIVRRPVSLLGITDAYDMDYVSPFAMSAEEHCPYFQYGSQKIYFGRGIDEQSAETLVKALNALFFSYDLDDDEDELGD